MERRRIERRTLTCLTTSRAAATAEDVLAANVANLRERLVALAERVTALESLASMDRLRATRQEHRTRRSIREAEDVSFETKKAHV